MQIKYLKFDDWLAFVRFLRNSNINFDLSINLIAELVELSCGSVNSQVFTWICKWYRSENILQSINDACNRFKCGFWFVPIRSCKIKSGWCYLKFIQKYLLRFESWNLSSLYGCLIFFFKSHIFLNSNPITRVCSTLLACQLPCELKSLVSLLFLKCYKFNHSLRAGE